MITKEYLLDRFNFDFENGLVVWKKSRPQSIGKPVGAIDKEGYVSTKINKKVIRLHRIIFFAFYGYIPLQVDHINGIKTDNRICNLREAQHGENRRNSKLNSNSTSGFKGVSFNKRTNKWQAYASMDKKTVHLGYFENKEDAAVIVHNYAKQTQGEFYRPPI